MSDQNPSILHSMPDDWLGKCGHMASCGRPGASHVAVPEQNLDPGELWVLDLAECRFLIVCDLPEHIEYVQRAFPVRMAHAWTDECLAFSQYDPNVEWHDDGCRRPEGERELVAAAAREAT